MRAISWSFSETLSRNVSEEFLSLSLEECDRERRGKDSYLVASYKYATDASALTQVYLVFPADPVRAVSRRSTRLLIRESHS